MIADADGRILCTDKPIIYFQSKGVPIGNTHSVDLFILDTAGTPTTLFEVKTDSTSTQVYEAVGQLFFHSAELRAKCKLIAVFPSNISQDIRDAFKTIGIQLLTYNFVNNVPVFESKTLSNILS